MDFIDQLRSLGDRIEKLRANVTTEEATKNAFIMPFIASLGYDVFNPMELVPEFTADVGTKKGEKVDYAILKEGKPIIIVECKHCHSALSDDTTGPLYAQLFRYFSVVEARIAVLTNGVEYWFYSDLEEPNKMDPKPFLEINLLDLKEPLIADLKKLSKSAFNIDDMLSAASDLKYRKLIKRILAQELEGPSEDFVKFFGSQVYQGRMTQSVKAMFTDIVQRAFKEFINERLQGRLQAALAGDMNISLKAPAPEEEETPEEEVDPEEAERRRRGIITTEEELEGFRIVRAILREVVDVKRVAYRDTKSYFGILLDDNNRKPLCRLHFNSSQNYIGIFDAEKNESRHPINDLSDIYAYAEPIKGQFAVYAADDAAEAGG